MTTRHMTVPHGFACITEDPTGLHPDIRVIPTPKGKVSGWWYKPWVFSKDIPLEGTLLFMDLDIVVIGNIDNLWTHFPGKFAIIKDFNRSLVKGWEKFNSSIFRLEKGQLPHVWENLAADWKHTTRMHGDQDWIYMQIKKDFVFWPDEWIQSYKWEIRNRNDIVRVNNKRGFKDIANPVIRPETTILVFHGDPKPNEVQDPVVVQNWI